MMKQKFEQKKIKQITKQNKKKKPNKQTKTMGQIPIEMQANKQFQVTGRACLFQDLFISEASRQNLPESSNIPVETSPRDPHRNNRLQILPNLRIKKRKKLHCVSPELIC